MKCSSLPSWASREDVSFNGKKNEANDRPKKMNSSSLEDRPIAGSRKNFDELLAEKLGNDQIQVSRSKYKFQIATSQYRNEFSTTVFIKVKFRILK
jgi:hypothetical protein